jgi:hypothetical protein
MHLNQTRRQHSEQDKKRAYKANTVERSLNTYTTSAIVTAWYIFTPRQRLYGYFCRRQQQILLRSSSKVPDTC